MSRHHTISGGDFTSDGGWEQQLQAAQRQYSAFFPDLDLPIDPTRSNHNSIQEGHSQCQPPGEVSAQEEDVSTLFCADAFMAVVAEMAASSLSPAELAASGLNGLKDSRRYTQASISQMELLDELDAELQELVTKTCRSGATVILCGVHEYDAACLPACLSGCVDPTPSLSCAAWHDSA